MGGLFKKSLSGRIDQRSIDIGIKYQEAAAAAVVFCVMVFGVVWSLGYFQRKFKKKRLSTVLETMCDLLF